MMLSIGLPVILTLSVTFFGELYSSGFSSGGDPCGRAREEAGRPDVLQPGDPPRQPLHAHTESGVEGHAELAEVEVPGERLGREVLALYPLEERVVLRDPLPPGGQLAEPLRGDEVGRLRDLRPVVVGHVVEGAGGKGEVCHEERGRPRHGHQCLSFGGDVLAPLELDTLGAGGLPQLVVRDAFERPAGPVQFPSEGRELILSVLEDAVDGEGDELLLQPHVRGLVCERALRLYHPELGEVLGSPGLFRPESRLADPDLLEPGERGLLVELGALAKVDLLPKVRDLEECGASLYCGLDERRSADEREPLPPEKVGRGAQDLRPYLHRCHRLLASDAQMTHVVEEGRRLHRGLRYRPRLRLRDQAEVLGDELDPPRGPLVFPGGPLDPDNGFPWDFAHPFYDLRRGDALLGRDLYVPCAVPYDEENDPTDAGLPRDPSADASFRDRPLRKDLFD